MIDSSTRSLARTALVPDAYAPGIAGRESLLDHALQGDAQVGEHGEVRGNDVRLVVDNAQLRPALLDDIRGARSVINLQEFIWTSDGLGEEVAEALKAKAREGVQVNVQLDGTGSSSFPFGLHPVLSTAAYKAHVAGLRAAGVHVQENWRYGGKVAAGASPSWDHRKIFTVDGRIGYVGGMNLSLDYEQWHDTMARIEGPAVAQLDAEFLGRWRDIGGTVSGRQARALVNSEIGPRQAGMAAARIISNSPGAKRDLSDSYLRDIRGAKRRLWVTSPSVASPELVRALRAAAARGVDVRVVTTSFASRDGDPVTRTISGTFIDELVEAGVQVYEHPRTLHAKLLLADDDATVSSFNLNDRSKSKDMEAGVRVRGASFTREIERLFDKAFVDAAPVSAERGRSVVRQAARGVRELFGLSF